MGHKHEAEPQEPKNYSSLRAELEKISKRLGRQYQMDPSFSSFWSNENTPAQNLSLTFGNVGNIIADLLSHHDSAKKVLDYDPHLPVNHLRGDLGNSTAVVAHDPITDTVHFFWKDNIDTEQIRIDIPVNTEGTQNPYNTYSPERYNLSMQNAREYGERVSKEYNSFDIQRGGEALDNYLKYAIFAVKLTSDLIARTDNSKK